MHSEAACSLRGGQPGAKVGSLQPGSVALYPNEARKTDPDPSRKQKQALKYLSIRKWKAVEKLKRNLDQV